MIEENDAEVVIRIASTVLKLNVKEPNRGGNFIRGRAICYVIMRDELKYTYAKIGGFFNKNHGTVMNGVKEFPWLMKENGRMEGKYWEILTLWKTRAKEYANLNICELKSETKALHEKIKELNSLRIKAHDRYKKIEGVVDVINTKLPQGKEKVFEDRVKILLERIITHG